MLCGFKISHSKYLHTRTHIHRDKAKHISTVLGEGVRGWGVWGGRERGTCLSSLVTQTCNEASPQAEAGQLQVQGCDHLWLINQSRLTHTHTHTALAVADSVGRGDDHNPI